MLELRPERGLVGGRQVWVRLQRVQRPWGQSEQGPEEAGLWVWNAMDKERVEADEGGGVGRGQTT